MGAADNDSLNGVSRSSWTRALKSPAWAWFCFALFVAALAYCGGDGRT